jgi:hypothetical protein
VNEPPSQDTDPKSLYILLTATVDIRGVDAARNDPLERLSDYRWALERWSQTPGFDGLIFVENSGYDIDSLRRIPAAHGWTEAAVEFLSFDGQDFPRHRGKGFGETVNLEHVLSNSRLLASREARLLRVNGRNYVQNIGAFADAIGPDTNTDILCDLRAMLIWGDGRVLGGSVRFFEHYVVPYGRDVDDSRGYYFEHALARAVHRAMADGLVWSPFPEPPRIQGFSGTSNQRHDEGPLLRMRKGLAHRARLRLLR